MLLETPGSFAARALVRSYPFRERASTREPLDVSILVLRITKSPVWTFTRGRTTGGACPPVPVRVGGAARRYAPRPRLVPGRGRCSPRTGTTPRQRINEVEEDTPEAFRVRRQLVKLLVEGITVGEKREDGNTEVRLIYRFDPPDGRDGEEDSVVDAIPNSEGFLRHQTA